jgi:type IV pilus assembly protein PilY1
MDACTGGRLDEPVFDINDDGVVDSQDLINIGTVENPLMVPPTGIQIAGRVLPPSILIVEDHEIKYFSSSRGTIETVTEKAAKTGIYYWMEF